MFTKTNWSHCFIPPHAISPDSSFTCTAEAPNGKETWEHELETHQHFFSPGYQKVWSAVKAVQGWMDLKVRKTHPQQYELFSAWVRSTKPGMTVSAGPPLWYCRAWWSCRKIKRKQQVVEWMKKVEQQVKKGRSNGTHSLQGDHRWSCPHCWVLFKNTADQSRFTAVLQQTILNHETRP